MANAVEIGRLGWMGLAIESTPGTPVGSPSVFLPFTDNSIEGKHQPIEDISARATRVKEYSSVTGRKHTEGDVTIYLDSINTGYLLKMAFGIETDATLNSNPNVIDHLFTPTVSGNAVTSATLWLNRGQDTEQISYASVDQLDIEIKTEGIATAKAKIMGQFPTTNVSAPALTTTSGTVFTWANMGLGFGATTQAAQVAAATKVTEFKCTIKNNLSLNYRAGNASPNDITYGSLEVEGSYTLFFENTTDRDNYYNLVKQSMVLTLTGGGLGAGGYSERLQMVFKRVSLKDKKIETGLDKLFAITVTFEAELDVTQAGFVEATLRNNKTGSY